MIHLEKIDARNLWDIIDLKVAKAQKGFVAPNDISILQAYVSGAPAAMPSPLPFITTKSPSDS